MPALAEGVNDQQADGWWRMLIGETDASAIVYLFTLHKLAERNARELEHGSPLRMILELEGASIFQILERLAPETFRDALALWNEEADLPLDQIKLGLTEGDH